MNPYHPNMLGRVVLITGANTGLGFETAREMLLLNATVIMAGRDRKRIDNATSRLETQRPAGCVGIVDGSLLIDLADLDSVRDFAVAFQSRYDRLDVLVANGGVFGLPADAPRTKQNFEAHFGTNHLAHHLLVRLLMPALLRTGASTGDARVVVVSSVGHIWGDLAGSDKMGDLNFERRPVTQAGFEAYTQSKLGNVLMAAEIARRYDANATGVRAFSAHPGTVATDMFRHFSLDFLINPLFWYFLKSPWQGAQTQIYLSVAPLAELQAFDGAYFTDCTPRTATSPLSSFYVNPQAFNETIAAALWEASDRLVGVA